MLYLKVLCKKLSVSEIRIKINAEYILNLKLVMKRIEKAKGIKVKYESVNTLLKPFCIIARLKGRPMIAGTAFLKASIKIA